MQQPQSPCILTAAVLLLVAAVLAVSSCVTVEATRAGKQKDERMLYQQAQKAFDARDFEDAASLFQLFLDTFPQSEKATWALQRLGESCEGLLAAEYTKRVEAGAPEERTRRLFLERFGRYECWDDTGEALVYNLLHYMTILEQHPDSDIADEAAYRVIPRETAYGGMPEGPERELHALEDVLERFPSTTLRYKILYEMAYRCHILYEIYAFSPRAEQRRPDRAQQYRQKAVYLYRLAMSARRHSPCSEKAWEGLSMLEQGRRIYVLQ